MRFIAISDMTPPETIYNYTSNDKTKQKEKSKNKIEKRQEERKEEKDQNPSSSPCGGGALYEGGAA